MEDEFWKDLGKKALIGGIFGLASGLTVVQEVDKALLIALATGFIRGVGVAVVGYIESQQKSTASYWKNVSKLPKAFSRLL